jgi:predicted O-methyltransferase YrrM
MRPPRGAAAQWYSVPPPRLSSRAVAVLDDTLLVRLATQSDLFHRAADGTPLSRALTVDPLRAVAAAVAPGARTLETGCGGSTVVFAAAGARHTVVTPSEAEVERVRAFCAGNGISLDTVDFRIGSSDATLPGWTEPLDVVLVDGAHRMPYPFIDWHYSSRALRVGGRLLLDDVAIPAVYVLFDYLRGEREWRLRHVHGDKLAEFEKIAESPPDDAGDWELQRYNLPWRVSHIPLRRRWRRARDWAMLGTRVRRVSGRE